MSNVRTVLGGVVGAWLAACAPGAGPAPGVPGAPQTVRVGLVVGARSVVVGGTGAVVAATDGGPRYTLRRGQRATVVASGGSIRVREWDAGPFPRLVLTPASDRSLVTVAGVPYRGAVEVVARNGGVTAVNRVGLDTYLVSVVGAEMGSRDARERAAVEAQAIASRTYALANLGRFASRGFDLRGSTADQAYGGVPSETDLARRAVGATRGMVVAHGGKLISAFYHSTCGPTTASPDEAFRSIGETAYLRPVSDARGDGGYYNDISPRYSWTVEWTGAELAATLRDRLPEVVGVDPGSVDIIRDVYAHRTGPSGRVVEVRIAVDGGEIPVFGPDIRTVFRMPDGSPLYSSFVRFQTETSDGVVSRLVATGYGFGHGVGLCQWGAIGRARAGHDVESIIEAYYQGATVERWY